MSIDQTDVVDIISPDPSTGDVILTISDHLDWADTIAHQNMLQTKLNRYLAFVESGEIMDKYPAAKGSEIVFRVVFKFAPDASGRAFLERARAVISSAGFTLVDKVRPQTWIN